MAGYALLDHPPTGRNCGRDFIWKTDCKTVALEQKINRPFWNEMQMSGVIINP